MTIVVHCQCGKGLKLKDEAAGKSVRCPACQSRTAVASPELAADPGLSVALAEPACPSCGSSLTPGAVLCILCGHDLRTGRRAGDDAAPAPSGRHYPDAAIGLVYWGTRFGFGLVVAALGLGLFVLGLGFSDYPGASMNEMALVMILGVIFAGIGLHVSAKGERLDWFQRDDDEMTVEQMILARGAPALAGIVVMMVSATGRIDILFLALLPLGMLACMAAIVLGVATCLVMSRGIRQRLAALASAVGYLSAPVLLLLVVLWAPMIGLAVLSLALGELFFLLWLRELGRQLEYEAAMANVTRLIALVGIGAAIVTLLAVVFASDIQAALRFPPAFSIGAFAFYLSAVLYAAAATVWRLRIMQALMEEIELAKASAAT